MTIKAWLTGTPEYLRTAQQGIPSTGLTASGTTQAGALQLTTDFNVFTTVASSQSCVLLGALDTTYAGTPGVNQGPCDLADTIVVVNHGAQTLSVFPNGTGKIANGSASAAFSVAATKTCTFMYIGSGNWAASLSA